MIQALAGSTQGDIEKQIGQSFNWWWGAGVATDDIVKANNHGNGDWTATAPCWAAVPNVFERPWGLGWSFVLLVLLGFSTYLILGAARQRVAGSAERWPHADFWREISALVGVPTLALAPHVGTRSSSVSSGRFPGEAVDCICAGAGWRGFL
eukprot:COSAG02_NODE_468_length_21758_cov_41.206796_1_plen_152_part_00